MLFMLFDQELKSEHKFYTERFYRLIGLYYDLVKEDYVEYERNQCRFDVEKELQSVIASRDASMTGAFKKMQTINKFYLQGGIDANADYSGDAKSVEQMQYDIIQRFDCKPSWPICLFDFTYKNKVPQYFAFRTNDDLTKSQIEDYFKAPNSVSKKKEEVKQQAVVTGNSEGLMIERNRHICTCTKDFSRAFKQMFLLNHPDLFGNEKNDIFNFQINNQLLILDKLKAFEASVKNYA